MAGVRVAQRVNGEVSHINHVQILAMLAYVLQISCTSSAKFSADNLKSPVAACFDGVSKKCSPLPHRAKMYISCDQTQPVSVLEHRVIIYSALHYHHSLFID